jgi:adhesin/invasin
MMRDSYHAPALLVVLAISACGGSDLTLPNEGQPAAVAIVRGDQQNGTIGQVLPDSLVVRVTDRFDNPVAGAEVTWTADNGGSVNPATSTTDSDGRAATTRILGTVAGTFTTHVTVAGFTGDPVVFVANALSSKLLIATQPGAIATSGTPLNPQPVLQLSDADGNPVAQSGVAVTVQISSGAGTLGGTTTATSDGAGQVSFTDLVITGPAGVRTLIFAADAFASVASSPIALGVGAPASIEGVAGEGQTATVGSAVPVAPAVLVKDVSGNPVAGIPVNFTAKSGGGSVAGADQITGADGKATVGTWTLGTKAGANTLEARIGTTGVSGNPVTFHATGQAGALDASKSTLAAAPSSIAASSGSVFSTITVTATDGFGNPLPNIPVAISATGTGNTIGQPSGPTNAQGVATGKFSSTSPGDHVVSATVGGSTVGQTATVTVTAGPPVASASSAQVGPGTAGTATQVTVNLRDASGNPVSGAGDKISVTVSGANNASGPVTETGGGAYTFSYTPVKTGTDQVRVRVNGTDVPGSPFASVVSAGPADGAHTTAIVAENFVFSTNITVTAKDANDNLLGRGGDAVAISYEAGSVAVTDNGDGTYSATFAPATTGTYHVNITINGASIVGSPFTSTRTF